MLGLDRSRRASRWLEWKVRIFTTGAVLAVAGMYLEESWMTGAAILVLLGGFFLRFLPVPGDDPDDDGAEDAGEDDASSGVAEPRGPGQA